MEQKPWYKSLTLLSAAITAISVFAPKYAPVIPDVVSSVATIAGIIGTVIGRLRATQQVTFTNTQN
jgi:dolichol kinase